MSNETEQTLAAELDRPLPTNIERHKEKLKYAHVYAEMSAYKMGDVRHRDASKDVRWFQDRDCETYLDIGCGRGEMLNFAQRRGFRNVVGTEVVQELVDGNTNVVELAINELDALGESEFDCVSCFDVIEHLLPGDDELLLAHMARIASKCLALTANNCTSIDPTTGNNLHINIRSYDEWDDIIRWRLSKNWEIVRMQSEYVSETWRAYRL